MYELIKINPPDEMAIAVHFSLHFDFDILSILDLQIMSFTDLKGMVWFPRAEEYNIYTHEFTEKEMVYLMSNTGRELRVKNGLSNNTPIKSSHYSFLRQESHDRARTNQKAAWGSRGPLVTNGDTSRLRPHRRRPYHSAPVPFCTDQVVPAKTRSN